MVMVVRGNEPCQAKLSATQLLWKAVYHLKTMTCLLQLSASHSSGVFPLCPPWATPGLMREIALLYLESAWKIREGRTPWTRTV